MRIFLLFALVLSLASCRFFGGERVRGDGNIVTQQRSVGSFDGIDVSGALKVQIIQEGTTAVKVQADQNLQEYIRTEVEDGVLHIYPQKSINPRPTKEIVVYVSAPVYNDIEVSGASQVQSQSTITASKQLELHASGASHINMDVNVTELNSDISGATTLVLRGRASRFSVEASGASDVKGMDLVTDDADLDLSGASNVTITANKNIRIEASGASDVEYRGNANVDQKSSGASSVKKVG